MPKRSASQSARLSRYGAQYGGNRAATLERWAVQEQRAQQVANTVIALANAWQDGLITLAQIEDPGVRELVEKVLGL